MAYAHFLASRYDMATSYAEKAVRENPSFLLERCILAAGNALAGRLEAAQAGLKRVLECSPDLRAAHLKELTSFRHEDDLARFANGLRIAGLPE